ncbi:leucine-rich repeats and immunoglobulin-like domains protein 1 isoform X2 [Sipha flava]|nr:leucine-rich repeats and immunoglobulin-like domains protein 1 isoform X2 [Sipha flava]
MSFKNVVIYISIIIATCAISSECFICDTCVCQNSIINCTENGLINILDLWEHTETLKDTTLMHFDYNGITHVKKLPSSKVKCLTLRHNQISSIEDLAFINLIYLKELDLSYNYLTTDDLNQNTFKISRGDSKVSIRPTGLLILRLDNNNLHSLTSRVFEEMEYLVSLSLAGNPLITIDRSTGLALSSLPMLRVLNLANTSICELPDHFLHTPRFLATINLSKNKFTQIPQGLSEVHALQRLDLSYNPIVSILNFPKMPSLKILHLSYMPELNAIGTRAFSNLRNLEEFHCMHNYKLESIDPNAFSYKSSDGSEVELWPNIIKLDLSYNALRYLDSNLLSRWDTLEELNLQGNKWECDCLNQWFVNTLAPMLESKHSEFLIDFTCREPTEMNGKSILDLHHLHYEMRCLDYYNHHPETDGVLLVGILIGVLLAVPFTMGCMMYCAKRKNSLSYYHRIFNQYKAPYSHEFQLRESSIYQPTSIIADGYQCENR